MAGFQAYLCLEDKSGGVEHGLGSRDKVGLLTYVHSLLYGRRADGGAACDVPIGSITTEGAP